MSKFSCPVAQACFTRLLIIWVKCFYREQLGNKVFHHPQIFFQIVLQENRTFVKKKSFKVRWNFLLDIFHTFETHKDLKHRHAHMCIHVRALTYIHTYICTYMPIYKHTHIYSHVYIHIDSYIHIHTCTHKSPHMHTYIYTHKHT